MGKARNSGRRSSRRIQATERQTQALQFRLQGAAFSEIAAHMGVTKTRVQQLVAAAMRERESTFHQTLEQVRSLELMRLDRLQRVHYAAACSGSLEATAIILKIQERRSCYLGLDAPTEARLAFEPLTAPPEVDLSQLSVDELRAFRDLMTKVSQPKLVATQPAAIEYTPGITINGTGDPV